MVQSTTGTGSGSQNISGNPLPFGVNGSTTTDTAYSTQLWADFMGFDWWGTGLVNCSGATFTGEKYSRATWSDRPLQTGKFLNTEGDEALQSFNSNNILIPIKLFGKIINGNFARIGGINDIRLTNIKNLSFGEVKDDGTDKWKHYPAFFKNAGSVNGNGNHSGQLGYAVRYDGP
jgi:hypothetical protein